MLIVCFKWCLIRYLNLVSKNPEKNFKSWLKICWWNFKGIKISVTVKGHQKVKEMNNIAINGIIYGLKCIVQIYNAKKTFEKHMEKLLITEYWEWEKRK